MVKLSNILEDLKLLSVKGDSEIAVKSICFDSREVAKGDMFVAVRGTQTDGHNFINQALKAGAAIVVCEELPSKLDTRICWILVENSAIALSHLASAFYGNPSSRLRLIGVTGTNGKTTIATLLYDLFILLGYKVGLISTVGNRIFKKHRSATHTTPDAIQLNRLLNDMVSEGCDFAFMEVSSIALDQYRTNGLTFEGALYTNLTHDHLDYHGTFDNYIASKKRFFDDLAPDSFALINSDDRRAEVMVQNCKAKVLSYGLKRQSTYRVKLLEERFEGMLLRFGSSEVSTRFIGDFNAYNLLAVYGTAMQLGADSTEVLTTISDMSPVEGRLEVIRAEDGRIAIVDYAHTPDALKNVLEAINKIKDHGISLITVVGAGGDRDSSKRPLMGEIAALLSDKVILTSDNPRSEDPDKIIGEMMEGVPLESRRRVLKVTDRREAIKTAFLLSVANDVILVAGKGHETYQEIKGVKSHFDDREEIMKVWKYKYENY